MLLVLLVLLVSSSSASNVNKNNLEELLQAHLNQELEDMPQALYEEMKTSAAAASNACSGPHLDAKKCAVFWTKDTTIFDLLPPDGVIHGRDAWEQRLELHLLHHPSSRDVRTDYIVKNVGWIEAATVLAWQAGFWLKRSSNGNLLKIGRYCAVMEKINDVWKFAIVGTMEITASTDWHPVHDPKGGGMVPIAQQMINHFVDGFNSQDYDAAFVDYEPDALFPVMKSLGGDTLEFAITELKRQRSKLAPVKLMARVDDVVFPVGNKNVAVAHGFMRMFDLETGIFAFGRSTFLLVLKRASSTAPWKISIDFSPNNWISPL